MELHKENIIELRNIRSLSGLKFFIPDYQRGYRWTGTQSLAMLKDFTDFIEAGMDNKKPTDEYYCLQPVVVKPKSWIDGDGNKVDGYEVIDGQQRLTTLYLLLSALFVKDKGNRDYVKKFQMFSISYQTRNDSQEFLENISIDDSRRYECIDFYHIASVFESFKSQLSDQEGADDRRLVELILGEKISVRDDEDFEENEDDEENDKEETVDIARNVRVIWYEIGSEEKATAENIFTRLNIGKIPLTNAELIKAMFLKESNFGSVTATKEKERKAQQIGIKLQQNKIADEWNLIEQKLQREDFWYFLGAASMQKDFDTRIEFIFDLMAGWNKDVETYHTFNDFQKRIKKAGKKKAAENVWKEIKDYFRELEYWYNDRALYHLIGFLIECGHNIRELMKLRSEWLENESGDKINRQLKKDEFLEKIEGKVCDCMSGIDLGELSFPNNDIRKVLLLFNVLSVIENERSDIKFPFDKYKKESWDKEHIASQTDKDRGEVPQDNTKRIEWIDDMLYYFTGIREKDARDSKGDEICDSNVKVEWVISHVKDYLNSENETFGKITDANQRKERETELILISKLLRTKELSVLTSKQRSASGTKEEYDALMKELFRMMRAYFKEDRMNEEEKAGLGNMALLNSSINRSYGNAFFAIKRMHIQDKDSEGVFIPLATKNVFMKYYSKRVDSMLIWTHDDATAYLDAIKKKVSRFIK